MKRRPKGQKRPLYRKEGDLRGSDTIDGNVTSLPSSFAEKIVVVAPSFIIGSNQLEHIGTFDLESNLTTSFFSRREAATIITILHSSTVLTYNSVTYFHNVSFAVEHS